MEKDCVIELGEMNIDSVLEPNDVETVWEHYENKIGYIVDKRIPIKDIRFGS